MTRRLRNVLILIGLAIPAVAVAASQAGSSSASCCPNGTCCDGGGCPLCPSHSR